MLMAAEIGEKEEKGAGSDNDRGYDECDSSPAVLRVRSPIIRVVNNVSRCNLSGLSLREYVDYFNSFANMSVVVIFYYFYRRKWKCHRACI